MEVFLETPTTTLYKENDRLLKVFKASILNDELKNQVIFNHKIGHIFNTILPNELYYKNNNLCGYYIPYIKPINLEKFFNGEIYIPVEHRITIVKDLFNALKEIHKYLIVGDIHLGNILINISSGFIIDLDYAKSIFSLEEPISKYYIVNSNYFELPNSFNSDINKLFIASLSILFQVNLECFLYSSCSTNDELVKFLLKTLPNSYLSEFAYDLKKHENEKNYKNYFNIDECNDLSKDILESRNKLIRNLHY